MKKKLEMKRYIIIAGALVALVSCAKVENFVSAGASSGDEIDFTSYTGRTLTKTDGSTFTQSFRVETFLSGNPSALYFRAATYRYINGRFLSDTTRYWPSTGESLDFYATSPLNYTNTSGASVALMPYDSSFTVTRTDGKTDIVASRIVNQAKVSPVNLTFGHKLTRVVFKAKGADTTKIYKIDSIIITANSTARYEYGATESWGASSDEYAYTVLGTDVTIPALTGTAQPVGEPMYLIPNQAATVKARIRYSIYDGAFQIDTTTNAVELDLPADSLWGINKSVVYKLTLNFTSSAAPITFTSEATESWLERSWDDPYLMISLPIAHYIEDGVDFGEGIKIGDDIWAPVNCGYDPVNYPYGKLYQWGRKYPAEYNAAWTDDAGNHLAEEVLQTNQATPGRISAADENPFVFYNVSNLVTPIDWLSPQDSTRWNSAPYPNSAGQKGHIIPRKTQYDPCPSGWRVPTYAEFSDLNGGLSRATDITTGTHGTSTVSGAKFDGGDGSSTTNFIFLPAAGFRKNIGSSANRGVWGHYFASTTGGSGTTAKTFLFTHKSPRDTSSLDACNRANALSVRCIYDQ